MAIKSGDICIIVGEVKGCEANVGAYVTVTEPDGLAWRFKDASRPLLGEFFSGITWCRCRCRCGCGCWPHFRFNPYGFLTKLQM
jgi:hypothetical protein